MSCLGQDHTTERLDGGSVATACAWLSTAIFALGLVGKAQPAWVLSAASAAAAMLLWRKRPLWKRPRAAWLALAPLGIWYVAQAWGPEFQPDAAGYQLGLVSEWLQTGRLPDRAGYYEVLPQGMGMLYGAAMSAGGATAARLLHLCLFAGCAGFLLRLSRSGAAALLFFAIPVAAVSGTSAYTDLAQVFFALAAVVLLDEERWFAAGVCTGFIYAIKITGLAAVAAALIFVLWRRRRHFARFASGALLMVAPWMVRAVWLSGNPVAPLGNLWFPNDAFHSATDTAFGESVRASLPWREIPWSLAVDGFALQGLLGPVFVLAAGLALLSLRTARGRWWLACAMGLLIPWLLNPGARFALLPAAFLCLAAAEAIPGRWLWAMAVLHAALSLPPAMERYTHPHAWRLQGWRDEMPKGYLDAARLVNRETSQGGRVLDLVGLPWLYLDRIPVGPMVSAEVDQLTDTLYQAVGMPVPTFELRADWPVGFARALRVRAGRPPETAPWQVTELAPLRAGAVVQPHSRWLVHAWPVAGDAALAVDGNPASRWQTWGPARPGAFVEVRFDRPVPLEGARVRLQDYRLDQQVRLYVQGIDRRWREASLTWRRLPPSLPRRAAAAFLRSRGIEWIVAKDEPGGLGEIGRALRMAPEAWGVTPAGRADNVWLYRLDRITR